MVPQLIPHFLHSLTMASHSRSSQLWTYHLILFGLNFPARWERVEEYWILAPFCAWVRSSPSGVNWTRQISLLFIPSFSNLTLYEAYLKGLNELNFNGKRYVYLPWILLWESVLEFIEIGFALSTRSLNNNWETVFGKWVDTPFKGVVVLWYLLESLHHFISDLCHMSLVILNKNKIIRGSFSFKLASLIIKKIRIDIIKHKFFLHFLILFNF